MKNIKILKLVEELKRGHSLIIETLKQARKLGIDTKEGQNEILSAKDTILAHMKKEDEEFYHVLRKAAESNGKLKELIAEFDNDINEISRYSTEFFDNKNVAMGSNFASEVENFIAILDRRILREETFLFKEFKKLNQ
jgi:hypothetical protein